MELPSASNGNLLFADKSGDMKVVQCALIMKKIREAESFENGKIVCIGNSFTSDEMKPYEDANGYRAEGDPREKKFMMDNRMHDLK